jgi:hypothetical protein
MRDDAVRSHARRRMMRALSIRQPFAEQILRGTKTIEYRTVPTSFLNKRFYIYASLRPKDERGIDLPRGVIVGTVEISACRTRGSEYHWLLTRPKRLARAVRPVGRPQPVWFYPFPSEPRKRKTAR